MKLLDLKETLASLEEITVALPNGSIIPKHFHITEIGVIDRQFIDCGGTLRQEKKLNIQLWYANDVEHRLQPQKLLQIIDKAEEVLQLENLEIEVEYEGNTIEKFGLEFKNPNFSLTPTHTDCLAKGNCGIPVEKTKRPLSELKESQCCSPAEKCC